MNVSGVSSREPQLRFLYLCCLLWFDSSVLSVEVTVQCIVYKYLRAVPSNNINRINFHLETELDAINL